MHTVARIFDVIVSLLPIFFLSAGLFFMFVGAVGVVRLPDCYHRLHAGSKCSTLGLLGLLLAAVTFTQTMPILTKAMMTLIFAFAAMPIGSHMLAKAAHADKAPQWKGMLSDDLEKDAPHAGNQQRTAKPKRRLGA